MSADDQDRRTHAPTPKRLADARSRGEVALSRDLTAVAAMAGGAIVGLASAHRALAAIAYYMAHTLDQLGRPGARPADGLAVAFASAAVPVAVGTCLGWLVSVAAQLGWPPTFRAPGFDLARIASPDALAQLASPKAAVGRAVKSVAKVAFVGLAAGLAAARELARFTEEPAVDARAIALRVMGAVARLAVYGGGALLLLALVDYVVARRAHMARLRMTPEEMKREHRESEGDPQLRRRRRQRMKELARRRLAVAVKGADVVLVNPTEYAVALRYRSGEGRAPKVVAKGRGAVAERIRELARQSGVPILAQPPLTRLLHKVVPEGREIPAALYHAVAEVLAHVYRIRGRRSAS